MKKTLMLIAVFVLTTVFTNDTIAQTFDKLDKSPLDIARFPYSFRTSDKVLRVTYSRPELNGRKVSKLAPAGKVWRTGANEIPEITFYRDVIFGGTPVKAGTYSLVTIPGEKEWTVILSKQLNTWGAYFYKKDEDVARVKGKVRMFGKGIDDYKVKFDPRKPELRDFIERFSITFDDDMTMQMGWGNVLVSVPIK